MISRLVSTDPNLLVRGWWRDAFEILFQFPVLTVGEIEPYAAAAGLDPVPDGLLGFEVEDCAAALGKLKDHVLAQECELLGEGGFEIFFEELAVPAVALHEAHIDPRHGDSIGEDMAKIFTDGCLTPRSGQSSSHLLSGLGGGGR